MELHLTLDQSCPKRVVLNAFQIESDGRKKPLKIERLSEERSFHALLLLLLMVKARPKSLPHEYSVPKRSTFIETLADKVTSKNIWSKRTVSDPLPLLGSIVGKRGGLRSNKNASLPSITYNAKTFPPQNIRLFVRDVGSKENLPRELDSRDELHRYATRLETANGFWGTACVQDLIDEADVVSATPTMVSAPKNTYAEKLFADGEASWPCKSQTIEGDKIDSPIRELVYHLRRVRGEGDALTLRLLVGQDPLAVNVSSFGLSGDNLLMLGLTFNKPLFTREIIGNVMGGIVEHPLSILDFKNRLGMTPLMKAAMFHADNKSLLGGLLSAGGNHREINHLGENMVHALAYGARQNSSYLLRAFHKLGVGCNNQSFQGAVPLALAISRKAPDDIIEYLLERTPDLSLLDGMGESLVYKAFKAGNFSLMSKLIERLDVRGKNWSRVPSDPILEIKPQLFQAIASGDIDRVRSLFKPSQPKTLMQFESEAYVIQRSALHVAVKWQRLEIIEFLLKAGANPFAPDTRGLIPREVLPDDQRRTTDQKLLDAISSLKRVHGISNDPVYLDHYGADGRCYAYASERREAQFLADLLHQACLEVENTHAPSDLSRYKKTRLPSHNILIKATPDDSSGYEVSFPLRKESLELHAAAILGLLERHTAPDKPSRGR